jgi:hypothetical protein
MKAAIQLALVPFALSLAACDSGPTPTVPPATAAERAEYSRDITDKADRKRDASLYEYFCMTTLDAPCPADIEQRLSVVAERGEGSRVNLADAFVHLRIAEQDGGDIGAISDEQYVDAAYQVILGRAPDEGGRASHLSFIKETGERLQFVRAALQSTEFKTR